MYISPFDVPTSVKLVIVFSERSNKLPSWSLNNVWFP